MLGFKGNRQEREAAPGSVTVLSGKQWEEYIRSLAEKDDHESVVWGAKRGEEGQKTDTRAGTWAISSVGEKPKFSENYINCTGIFVVGIDKETKKPISLLTHQDDTAFTFVGTGQPVPFLNALEAQLKTFKERAKPGSVTVGFFAGMHDKKGLGKRDSSSYDKAYKAVEGVVRETLDIRVEKVTKPHTGGRDQSSFAAHIDRDGIVHICEDASGPGRVLSQLPKKT